MRVVPTVLINNYQAMVRKGERWRAELEDVKATLLAHGHIMITHTAPAAPYLRFLEALGAVRATQPADSYVFHFEPMPLLTSLYADDLPDPEEVDAAVRAFLLDRAGELPSDMSPDWLHRSAGDHVVH